MDAAKCSTFGSQNICSAMYLPFFLILSFLVSFDNALEQDSFNRVLIGSEFDIPKKRLANFGQ